MRWYTHPLFFVMLAALALWGMITVAVISTLRSPAASRVGRIVDGVAKKVERWATTP